MHDDLETLATPANMRAFEEAHPARKVNGCTILPPSILAYSPTTGEEYSASSGDYWNTPDSEPLTGEDGEPMYLVVRRTLYVDAREV